MSRSRIRLLALAVLLGCLAVVALYLRLPTAGDTTQRPGLLQTRIDEPAFGPDAPAADILELAKRTADQLVEDYPDAPSAWSVQARRHYLLYETEEAIDLWRKSLEMDANFAGGYFGLGLVALDRGQYEAASERFEAVARLDAEDPRAPVLWAKSRLLAGNGEDAILILEQHVTTQRTSAEAWELLGQAHLQTQRFDRAAECFEVAVGAVPSMKDAVYGLSQAYAALGDTQKANEYAERFRSLEQETHARTTEEAVKYRDRDAALRIAGQAYADAARVYQEHGATQQAENCLLRAVLLKPNNTEYLAQLQQSLQQRGAHAAAVEVGERIVELAPQQLDQWLNLGWLYSTLRQPEQAIAACRKAIELDPNDPRCRQAHEIIRRFQ